MNEKQKPRPVRNFVKKHRVAVAVIATSAVWIAITRRAVKQHEDFLKEKDLYDEFYNTEES